MRRVIVGLIHGGHAIVDSAPNAEEATETGAVTLRLSEMVQEPELAELDLEETLAVVGTTDFDLLVPRAQGTRTSICQQRMRRKSTQQWRP